MVTTEERPAIALSCESSLSILSETEIDAVSGGRHGGMTSTSANTVINIVSVSIGEIIATGNGPVILAINTNAAGGGMRGFGGFQALAGGRGRWR
ncbi:MAG: hypothetical protein U1E70_24720 [Acetobacteraceae bacterium]|nr:hypothetical protein [Pseudomonadota bacterium]